MPEPVHNKALFRFIFAFSSGKPAVVFDLEEDWLRPGSLRATANNRAVLRVAVARNDFGLDFGDDEWPESMAAAYEEFVSDPEISEERFDWIEL